MLTNALTLTHRSSTLPPAGPDTSPAPVAKPPRPAAPLASSHSNSASNDPPLPNSPGIPPARRSALAVHFNVTAQQAFITDHDSLTIAMRRLHSQQPDFKNFQLQQLATLFTGQPQLNPPELIFKRWIQQSDGSIKTLSEQPLLDALDKKIAGLASNTDEDANVLSGIFTQGSASEASTRVNTTYSLDTIAQRITEQYPNTVRKFWTTPRLSITNPRVSKAPQDELLHLHKQHLSTLAALRASDSTLSPASKKLIDTALQYPTLAEREQVFANGARLGVYPLTLDDGTEHGALLTGTFLITQTDGSFATPPAWPNGRTLALNDANGPVVLYTPGEGFEEFATPALAREALAQRLDQAGVSKDLLLQTLPLSLQNRPDPPTGDDLMLSAEPLPGDVLAAGVPGMLKRQQAEINASLAQIPAQSTAPLHHTIDEAADWSYLLDGSNAMQARNQKLTESLQPEWLQNLTPGQEAFLSYLEQGEEKSANALNPLLETIPSLATFARDRMNAAITQLYPTAELDAGQLVVQAQTRTRIHTGRPGPAQEPSVKHTRLSLADLALKNPTEFPAGEPSKFTQITFKLPLIDKQGKPILDTDGNPVVLGTHQLKAMVNSADVGGEYTRLLKKELATDAVSGPAGERRKAWKTSQMNQMYKELFLSELNPSVYKAEAKEDKTSKRAEQWVAAVVYHPDPANRPSVDGQPIVAHTLLQRGLPVQGVMVIANGTDPERVLYTPNAPDGVSLREMADQNALNTLLEKNEWTLYTANRKSPTSKGDVAKAHAAIVKHGAGLGMNSAEAIDAIVKTLKLKGDANTLTPIMGNIQDALYQQQVQLLVDKADHQSVSSAEVAAQSTTNKAQFGIEVATIFLDLLPVVGKGASTAARLGKAGVTALRANAKVLPKLIKHPGLGRAIYADFATSATGIPLVRTSQLRPVLKVPMLKAPPPLVIPSLASSSSGSHIATTGAPSAAPLPIAGRDLSRYAVADTLIQGRPLRPDGTYNVADQWYVRFTDSTGTNKVYQIDSAFHARSGRVNIVDPNAAPTAPKSSKIVASVQSAGNGEWRLNELPGGVKPLPETEYVSRSNGRLIEADFTEKSLPVARHWFRRDAQRFYQNMVAGGQMPPRPPRLTLAPGSSPADLFRDAYKTNDVVVLGELHNEIVSFQVIKENMQALKEAGVTTLALENVEYNAAGKVVDVGMGNGRPAGALPTLAQLSALAHENGITIKPLDHRYLTRRSDMPGFYNDVADNDKGVTRLQEFNYYAARMLQNRKPGEKVLAVVGRSHMNTARHVPGLAELTGGIGIGVYPATTSSRSIAISGPSIPRDPGSSVTGSHTAGDYQIFHKIT
jgi:hypothetical protein